jgi:hypothetical protein
MNLMRRFLLTLSLLLVIAPAAGAQQPQPTLQQVTQDAVHHGWMLRVSAGDSAVIGRAISATEDELRIVGGRFDLSEITKVERKGGGMEKGTRIGAIIGAGVFALLGWAVVGIAASFDDTSTEISPFSYLLGGAAGAAIGAAIGGVIGSAFNHGPASWIQLWATPAG